MQPFVLSAINPLHSILFSAKRLYSFILLWWVFLQTGLIYLPTTSVKINYPSAIIVALVRDCGDVLKQDQNVNSGVFTIYGRCMDPSKCSFPLPCEQDNFGGGWTVCLYTNCY